MWPGDIIRALAVGVPPETIVTTDVGSHKYLFGQFWPSRQPETFWMGLRRRFAGAFPDVLWRCRRLADGASAGRMEHRRRRRMSLRRATARYLVTG